MSGQWNPYARETEREQPPNEVAGSLDAEIEDNQADAKHDSRFKRRID
jgi:hypothetical protein